MAYTLRDIIKQRTGELASNFIAPTIYKFYDEDGWIEDYDITEIGVPIEYEDYVKAVQQQHRLHKLPSGVTLKQVGTNVTKISTINVENGVIPPDIFKYATNIVDFSYVFQCNGDNIVNIPKGLFDHCKKAQNFACAFRGQNNIKHIPKDLFAKCPEAKDFDDCFAYCINIEGEVPELWNIEGATGYECFYGLNPDLVKNWDDIPDTWKKG